jgi:hypothetical protein
MAILINQDVSIMGGISIDQLYLRMQYSADLFGKTLSCYVYPYFNKTSFLDNWQENILKGSGLPPKYDFAYDSSINGGPLQFLHEKIKDNLKNVYEIDPSTLLPVLVKQGFTDEANITFVDLD